MTTPNLEAPANMEYPGRFIIAGKSLNDEVVAIYGLTGRSPPSKARRLEQGQVTNTVFTKVTDPEQLAKGSPALLLYPAMVTHEGTVVVSNGAQTKVLYSALRNLSEICTEDILLERTMDKAMGTPFWEYDQQHDRWIDLTSYEPDPPHNTPRINMIARGNKALFHIVREENNQPKRTNYHVRLEEGRGWLLSTYNGQNVDPLPSFQGSPRTLDLDFLLDNPTDVADHLFNALREDVRVAVAAMYVRGDKVVTAIKNKE